MTENDDGERLNDAEIALMDAIKTVIELVLMAGVAKTTAFDRMFAHQQATYVQKEMPTAAAVMTLLRSFVNDPKREANREEIRKFLKEPPEGSA